NSQKRFSAFSGFTVWWSRTRQHALRPGLRIHRPVEGLTVAGAGTVPESARTKDRAPRRFGAQSRRHKQTLNGPTQCRAMEALERTEADLVAWNLLEPGPPLVWSRRFRAAVMRAASGLQQAEAAGSAPPGHPLA